ncbi:MAG: hypothetical protein LBL23_03815 [Coriobacteriales bacterium]|nr:hypothetical protein [Coriobacteriales bacterium]
MFESVRVDVGGYGIVLNEALDLSAEELWEHGTVYCGHDETQDCFQRTKDWN